MRHFLSMCFGLLALIVFLLSCCLFAICEMLEPPPKNKIIRPDVMVTQW